MNRNKVHIGKRLFIIRSVEKQVKLVLGMSYLSQTFRPPSKSKITKSSQNHQIFTLQLILIILPISLYITNSPSSSLTIYILTMIPNPFIHSHNESK